MTETVVPLNILEAKKELEKAHKSFQYRTRDKVLIGRTLIREYEALAAARALLRVAWMQGHKIRYNAFSSYPDLTVRLGLKAVNAYIAELQAMGSSYGGGEAPPGPSRTIRTRLD